MKYPFSYHHSLLIFPILMATNFWLLRLMDHADSWSFQQLILRGTLVGISSCCCIWCCRRIMSPAILSLIVAGLAVLNASTSPASPPEFFNVWFLAMMIQLVSVSCSWFLLTRIPEAIDVWYDATEEAGGKAEKSSRASVQLTSGNLVAMTSAVAIVIACIQWAEPNSQYLWFAIMVFGCCGILTAVNFWSAVRYDAAAACAVTILILLAVSGLLKLLTLDLQQWLTAVVFMIVVQLTVLFAALAQRDSEMKNALLDHTHSTESPGAPKGSGVFSTQTQR